MRPYRTDESVRLLETADRLEKFLKEHKHDFDYVDLYAAGLRIAYLMQKESQKIAQKHCQEGK